MVKGGGGGGRGQLNGEWEMEEKWEMHCSHIV